ncbi:MAG TPA: site-2 protease family protein [Ramlibacter sp.]|nr:site-2 protease family protein [Ramlibacter sp.]
MEWIQQGLLALGIGVPAIVALMLVTTASRLTRLRFRRSSVGIVKREDVAPQARLTMDTAQAFLAGLDFAYRYSTATTSGIETESGAPVYSDVYQHADGRTHVSVTPSSTPELGEPCTLMWATLLQSGRMIATTNCFRHNMVIAPAGWTLHDDYLPDLHAAWERHRSRVDSAKGPIVQDGMAFYRATKLATETLMSHGEKKGLLVRRGEHWLMPWRVALSFAWKLFLAQRKAAKVRSRAAGRAPALAVPRAEGGAVPAALDRVQADIEAYGQQQAVLRAARWSARSKFKVFLLTGALFLGVGSLWISWTFLPILLAVIGLHEGGHYLAMKISGYRNLSVFFVPGLGGLATGEKPSASPWEKLFVYLAGPMPGIALAVGGLIAQFTGAFVPPPWFQEFLIACLIINYLNLLPITPLDGGRVVETFLFARLPVARFAFAVLGLAAFLAYGLSSGDTVMLVIAVLVALSLPHQWRIMRVDRAIERVGSETLDERTAIERVFTALQQPRFAQWPFALRSAAATALLPELQGRRAGAVEAVGGIVIYLACLVAPPVAAVLAVPQLAGIASMLGSGFSVVADDVDAEPASPASNGPARDWVAEAGQAGSLPEAQRLEVLLKGAEAAADNADQDKAVSFLKAAWELAEKRPAQDFDRARTLLALARHDSQTELRRQRFQQLASELEGANDQRRLLLLADAKEELAWEHDTGSAERIGLARQVIAHRQAALAEGAHELVSARLLLARELDSVNAPGEAEALLRQNVASIAVASPADRSREALNRRTRRVDAQVQLAWFLNAQGRSKEASSLMDAAIATVPSRVSISWEHANRQAREAQLWARLQYADRPALEDSWDRYVESRSGLGRGVPTVLQEVDRYIVAQAIGDAAQAAAALASIQEVSKSSQVKALPRLCAGEGQVAPWRSKQQQARVRAVKAARLCDSQSP